MGFKVKNSPANCAWTTPCSTHSTGTMSIDVERVTEAYERMMSGKARFRVVLKIASEN
jgi:hypothetical protein